MGILRKTVQREVIDILDNSVFTSNDFSIKFGDPDKEQKIFVITFSHSDNYYYQLSRDENPFGGCTWLATKSPGELEENETVRYENIKDCFSDIGEWCEEIRNELKAIQPIYSEVDNLRKIILEHINGDESEEEFSVKEIFEIKENFALLQKRVEKLENDKVITEKQLNDFKNGLIQVTDDIEHYPKKTWVHTASNKLVSIISSIGKSKEGRQVLAEGAKKLLGME